MIEYRIQVAEHNHLYFRILSATTIKVVKSVNLRPSFGFEKVLETELTRASAVRRTKTEKVNIQTGHFIKTKGFEVECADITFGISVKVCCYKLRMHGLDFCTSLFAYEELINKSEHFIEARKLMT